MSPDELTRRGWILRLGGAALLREVTISGLAAAEHPPLPPGLYEPSLQHLAHSLKTAIAPLPEQPSPQYFDAEDFAIIRMLVARILGEETADPVILEIAAWIDLIVSRAADTRAAARALSPAHRRLAVDYYGEDTVRDLESEDTQAICRGGLAALKGRGFQDLDPAAQVAHLLVLENGNDPFVAWIKRRTLDGFYTSRRGLQELDFKGNAFYAESPGCDHENRSQ